MGRGEIRRDKEMEGNNGDEKEGKDGRRMVKMEGGDNEPH